MSKNILSYLLNDDYLSYLKSLDKYSLIKEFYACLHLKRVIEKRLKILGNRKKKLTCK